MRGIEDIEKLIALMHICRACLHDPEAYPDPDRFMPERFLKNDEVDPDVCDPARFAFGYGRR